MLYGGLQNEIRRWCVTAAASVALACAVAVAPVAYGDEELVVLTWADYIDPEIVVEFERETNVEVTFAYYESNDARDEILTNSDGRDYDLAVVNGLMIQSYAQRDWLAAW